MHIASFRPPLPPARPTRPIAPAQAAPVGGAGQPGWYGGSFFRLLSWAMSAWPTQAASAPPAAAPGGFVDQFDALDLRRWRPSGTWANGGTFDCGWRPDHVTPTGGQLALRISDTPAAGQPYAAGEVATKEPIRYGRVEARMKPIASDGVITSLFTYTGPADGRPHHEIDIEFLGDDPTTVQLGYFTDGKHYAVEKIDLGFDASRDFHTYAFEWGPSGITWFVDGKAVKHADGSEGPLPSQPQRVIANVWPTRGADGWAGHFRYPGAPLEARYDWIAAAPARA